MWDCSWRAFGIWCGRSFFRQKRTETYFFDTFVTITSHFPCKLHHRKFGGTQRLARLVGMGRAKEMIFTCDNIDANEAYRIGLVNKVVAKEELMATAKAMAAKIISKGSYAVSVAKAAINNGYDMDIKNAVEMEANLFGVVNDTHDKKEGMGAFLEKRAANLTDF